MLFNSIEFAIYLPVVFILYWLVSRRKLWVQNSLLVVASYFFYGWWDWRFLPLIFFSSVVDFFVGIGLSRCEGRRKRILLLSISILMNLGLLGFFKYFNFFSESFAHAFTLLGKSIEPGRLNIILPVGISFYTFQTLSYSIDIFRRKFEPTRNFISFLAFVSFFPQLVAGPIERAANLLPQFYKPRKFEYSKAVDGLRQILWGLFKKVVIADSCAKIADRIFDSYAHQDGATLLLGAVFFAFQIYGDFSGYSDIAIGTSRLFGFGLMKNFAFPYFSRDIAEFWRRWHISLSTWFRDYLYIPLGGSKGGIVARVRNTFIIFVVSGFWHGANWTFIVWGMLNALYFIPLMLGKRNRLHMGNVAQGRLFPSFRELVMMLTTFMLSLVAWIFFRSPYLGDAFCYIKGLLRNPASYLSAATYADYTVTLCLVAVFLAIEWIGREKEYAIEKLFVTRSAMVRYGFYYLLVFMIFWFGETQKQFIYFQF